LTTLARGPMGAQVAAEQPDGTGHPALRGLPAADVTVTGVRASGAAVEVVFGQPRHTGEAGRAGS
jgi:hypothetical protein